MGKHEKPVRKERREGQRGGGGRFRLPRARMAVPFELTIGEGPSRRFSALLRTRDLSVTGAFLESSYFLPVGTRLQVAFQVDENQPPLRASAEIVRHEQGSGEESGFAIRFFEFEGDARAAVTALALGEKLSEFAERYLASRRARSFSTDLERTMDLVASWEVFKATGR